MNALIQTIVNAFNALIAKIVAGINAILDWFKEWIDWGLDLVEWIPKKLWAELLEGFKTILEAIPVPGWVQDASGATMPAVVVWLADAFQIVYGLGVIGSAYMIRFLIRRIPVIG